MSASETLSEILDRGLERSCAERDALLACLAGASDEELIALAYRLAGKLECDEDSDDLYAVLTEVFERHMSEACWRELVQETKDCGVSDLTWELESAREAVQGRAAARIAARLRVDGTIGDA